MRWAVAEPATPIAAEQESDELIKLIRKLRWIGLEAQAKELRTALEQCPSPHRGSLVAGPHSTD